MPNRTGCDFSFRKTCYCRTPYYCQCKLGTECEVSIAKAVTHVTWEGLHPPLSYYLAFSIYGLTLKLPLYEDSNENIMGYKSVWFGLCCILFAYFIYTPLPEDIEEPWKVMVVDAGIKLTSMTVIALPQPHPRNQRHFNKS